MVARLLWAKTVKRVLWTEKRTVFGAAVKNFKVNTAEIFGNRKRADKAKRRFRFFIAEQNIEV